jgi:diguanylate cyclase (GGDEF)-like protein/PAS domain S-box-containing protein
MLLNTSTPVGLASRRRTGWLIKISLAAGVAWFTYQLAHEIGYAQNTFQQSPASTIAFLALALTVAGYAAMRQQADLGGQPHAPSALDSGAAIEKASLVGAIEESSDAVVISNGEGTIEYVNPAYTRMTGYSAEEVIGHNPGREKSGLGPAFHQRVGAVLRTGKAFRGEVANRRKDGSSYVEDITVSPVRDAEGATRQYIAIRRDLTARHAENDSQAFLKSIVEACEDAIVGTTPDGIIRSWNRGAERLYGYRAEEAVGMPFSMLAPAGGIGETNELLDRVGRGETISQLETVTVDRGGDRIEVSLTLSPVRNGAGQLVGSSAIARDIRRRRRDRDALQHSEEKYRMLVDHLPDVVWTADARGDLLFVSPYCKDFSGYTPEEHREPGFWLKQIHPGDSERVQAGFRALFDEGRAFDAEYRLRRRDGEWIWVHDRALSTYEVNGQRQTDGIISDITERKRMEQKLAHQATHDLLTGLPNRVIFEDRFRQLLARARRQGRMAGLIYLDLDRFKRINETLGHLAGDTLIQSAAQRLAGCLRESETLSRSGGDRFTLAIGEVATQRDAIQVADRIMAALTRPFTVKGQEVFLSASIGIALFPRNGHDLPSLQQAADSALHAAKRQGKRRIQLSTPEISHEANLRLAIETELHHALERDELSVHYQPQFDLATGQIFGFEALLRWDNPKLGRVPPSMLIPIAEESGLIVPIGARVLRDACRQAKAWMDAGYGPLQMAVNTSAVQFARGDLTETVAAALAESGLEPWRLDLEVTESVIMQDIRETARQLKQLKTLGVSVSLDDFGTGYSSLSYLEELPIDNLKIDQKFVQRMKGADSTRTLVESIVGLAHGLGMRAVAEGVETEEQLEQLKAMGCDRAQSFMLGGPAPAASIQALLARAAAPCAA